MANPNVTKPAPFTRSIYGNHCKPSYRKGKIVLTRGEQLQWNAPLTMEAFQEAIKDIARERSFANRCDVLVQTLKGTVLYVAVPPGTPEKPVKPTIIKPTDADNILLVTAGAVTYMVHRYVRLKTLKGKTEHEINAALLEAHQQLHQLTRALEAE